MKIRILKVVDGCYHNICDCEYQLKTRFPNNFTQEHALNRDLEKERAILEGEVV